MQLLIQTSSGKYELALADKSIIFATSKTKLDKFSSRIVLEHFNACLDTLGVDVSVISKILVDVGPGGLAATRSGVSFANALSYSRSIPLEGVATFELMRAFIQMEGRSSPLFCLRRGPGGDVFWAEYSEVDNGTLRRSSVADLHSHILSQSSDATVVGAVSLLEGAGELPGCQLIPQLHVPMEAFLSARVRLPIKAGNLKMVFPITEHESLPNVRA